MSARLGSFQQAFEDASVQPSPDDLQQIWQDVTAVYKAGIGRLKNQMEQHARITGLHAGSPERAESAVAHEHDRVLSDWKVWRTRVGLAGVQQAFSANRLQELHELPLKQDLLNDLNRLLDTELGGIAVLFIDLDNFKTLNDTAGHPAGDKCLERIARIVGSAVLHKGRLYRYASGDEFMVILPNVDQAEAASTAERIRRTVETENPGETVQVTASIGVVVGCKTTYASSDEVLKAADNAMYEAKKRKNAVSVR